jgi:hypothetical protein
MVPNLDQFLSILAITASPCPIRKVDFKYSVYPLFNQYRKKISFEVQLPELWTVDCGLLAIIRTGHHLI